MNRYHDYLYNEYSYLFPVQKKDLSLRIFRSSVISAIESYLNFVMTLLIYDFIVSAVSLVPVTLVSICSTEPKPHLRNLPVQDAQYVRRLISPASGALFLIASLRSFSPDVNESAISRSNPAALPPRPQH